jgi:phosphonate transport system permease protein
MANLSSLAPRRGIVAHARRPSLLNSWTLALAAFAVAFMWSLFQAGVFNKELVNPGGWTLVSRFIDASLHPDLSADILGLILPATLTTLAFAVCGTAVSLVIGIVGGILSSEVWWQSAFPGSHAPGRRFRPHMLPWLSVRGALAVPRAIHEVIWGLFFINILGLDPLVAVLAIGIPFGAITAKVYADILDETSKDAMRALQNSGVSPLKSFLYTLLPQAFPDLLSYGFYRLECAIRSAAVLGLIGAGGLGYQILLSLQSLKYDQVWTFLYALILLSGLTDGWSSLLHRRLHMTRHGKYTTGLSQRGSMSAPFARFSLLALLALVPFSFWYAQVDFGKLFAPRTSRLFAGVIQDVFPPNLAPDLLSSLLHLSAQTLSMSILAITVAGFGGLLLSFPAAANFSLRGGIFDSDRRPGWQSVFGPAVLLVSRGVLLISRAMSEGIWALLVLFVFFPGILPGALALGLYNLGVLGRLMAEVTENVDNRPLRALKGQGATNAQVFIYGVLPQTLPKHLAYVLYRWEVCVRATVLVGLVGAGGLGRLLGDQLASFDYRSVLTSLIFYVGLTFLVDMLSALVRRAVR